MFRHNFGLDPINKDIREVESSEIPEVDVVLGGFPCPVFSTINKDRQGIDDDVRGRLFFEMIRIIKEKKPRAFVAENVKGILSANNREAFPLILNEFESAGYTLTWQLMNGADWGIPQKRERVIIVGVRSDLGKSFVFPDAPIKQAEDQIPLGVVLEPVVDTKYYYSTRAVEGMYRSRLKGKGYKKGNAQDITKPCLTITANISSSLNSTHPVLCEEGRWRKFTPREVARIQSFPDDYELVGSDTALYKALGNAIPPVMMWWVAQAISEQIE